jgi:hypothetical protein
VGQLGAFGQALLILQPEEDLIVGPIDSAYPVAVVPLQASPGVNKHFGYNPANFSLVAQKSGVYLAEFYIQLANPKAPAPQGDVGGTDPTEGVVMALRKIRGNDVTRLASTQLPVSSAASNGAQGTHQELLKLSKGDEVQLAVTALPSDQTMVFQGGLASTNVAAYLTLIKVS